MPSSTLPRSSPWFSPLSMVRLQPRLSPSLWPVPSHRPSPSPHLMIQGMRPSSSLAVQYLVPGRQLQPIAALSPVALRCVAARVSVRPAVTVPSLPPTSGLAEAPLLELDLSAMRLEAAPVPAVPASTVASLSASTLMRVGFSVAFLPLLLLLPPRAQDLGLMRPKQLRALARSQRVMCCTRRGS